MSKALVVLLTFHGIAAAQEVPLGWIKNDDGSFFVLGLEKEDAPGERMNLACPPLPAPGFLETDRCFVCGDCALPARRPKPRRKPRLRDKLVCGDGECVRRVTAGHVTVEFSEPDPKAKHRLTAYFRADGRAVALVFSEKSRIVDVRVLEIPTGADAVAAYETLAEDACSCESADCIAAVMQRAGKMEGWFKGVKLSAKQRKAITATTERVTKCLAGEAPPPR